MSENCLCDFYPPKVLELIEPEFLAELARHHRRDGERPFHAVLRVFKELYNHHSGTLYGFPEVPREGVSSACEPSAIDLDATYKNGLDVFEWALGGDWARNMRRFLKRADGSFGNAMKQNERLLVRVLLLHYAREIEDCRLSGTCSCGIPTAE